jgi:serine kinase of HPr protein (carbohydrate metabolism regulator)
LTNARLNIHGVAVALGECGLLILGESGAGKSALAANLLAAWPDRPVRLVADDRVLIERRHNRLVARPHPAIAGKLEFRGFGIVAPEWLDAVVLRAAITLGQEPVERLPERPREALELLGLMLPHAELPAGGDTALRLASIWPYFSERHGSF